MTDLNRAAGLMTRQENKLDDLEHRLMDEFRKAAANLPPSPSLNEVARWLKKEGVPTSAHPKAKSNWVPQTVLDWLYIDGPEATQKNLEAEPDGRHDGFLLVITRLWMRSELAIRACQGEERRAYEELRVERHLERIRRLSKEVREIFPRI